MPLLGHILRIYLLLALTEAKLTSGSALNPLQVNSLTFAFWGTVVDCLGGEVEVRCEGVVFGARVGRALSVSAPFTAVPLACPRELDASVMLSRTSDITTPGGTGWVP